MGCGANCSPSAPTSKATRWATAAGVPGPEPHGATLGLALGPSRPSRASRPKWPHDVAAGLNLLWNQSIACLPSSHPSLAPWVGSFLSFILLHGIWRQSQMLGGPSPENHHQNARGGPTASVPNEKKLVAADDFRERDIASAPSEIGFLQHAHAQHVHAHAHEQHVLNRGVGSPPYQNRGPRSSPRDHG